MSFFVQFVDILVGVLYVAILLRVVLSWFPMGSNNPIAAVVYQITEPVLAPLRRVVPRLGLIDITPMVAILLLTLIQLAVHAAV
ncbi:MAG: YggT family protein [Chloroflexi bacterium]|nr:YggT family protein [Chloroflexota bacterium]